jgi:hypothetical protein
MELEKIRTAGELVLEIRRTEEAIAFFRGADSITVGASTYDEKGQKCKMKRRLDRGEISEAVDSILSRHIDALRADLRKIEKQNEVLAAVKEAALKIDPTSAEVDWSWGNWFDPYGIIGREDLVPECRDYYRELYWARSPGSDIWVEFDDLPDETRKLLWKVVKETYGSRRSGDCS